MPVINGVYLKDFTALPGAVADANIIPIAISGNQIAYRTTVSGIVTDARVTSKLLTGLSVTGGAISATDSILTAFGKVQSQVNGKQNSITLTTTGSSGASTLIGSTLNIPNYGDALSGYVTLNTAQTITALKTFTTVDKTTFTNADVLQAVFNNGSSTLQIGSSSGVSRITSSGSLAFITNYPTNTIPNVTIDSAGALTGTSASFSSTATASAFIPSGASIPTNGMYLSAANTLDFATNSVNRLSISSAGPATFSSGIAIGGATATTGGIQFPATAVAIADGNNLDDYEEGTWTPILTTSEGTPPTVVSSAGRYVIIGKLVNIYFKFTLSSASGGTAQLKITNSPLTISASTIKAVGFARSVDYGLTYNCGFLSGTIINLNKYDGSYAGIDFEVVGMVSYYND